MLLSQIKTNASVYQFRETPFSPRTVDAIVAEGINLSKFDPIPVIRSGKTGTVAGDGHSRFEAILRLAKGSRLPACWKRGHNWDIPTREVTADEARILAWTANLSRDNFSPCEEARVFQSMLDAGKEIDQIAALVHKSPAYVRKTIPLNCLCRDIRAMVGATPDAGGLDKHIAQALAEKIQQYKIGAAQQQELWHRVLKHADLTVAFVRALIDRIGGTVASSSEDGMLFNIPASVTVAVEEMKDRANQLRRAERGLAWLMQCKDSGVLDQFPEMKSMLDARGESMLSQIKGQTASDANVIGQLCLNT